ncbi:hypothetical protein THII_0459 [Thioploca ingrica]|uniref:Choice-of-anchor D domain-containing protein n=1 Tax=Thioploca ingrica TaxID=40754 RepID=A0A090BUA3_9GAMM|nr:hypothetical protein THII_0459 [Thioploca ingrica]
MCGDTTCTINNTLTSVAVGNVDWYSSIKLNAQGYPVISYLDKTSNNLKLAVCGNVICTVNNSFNPINNAGESGAYSSLTLNNQGYPVISYIGVDSKLKLAVCGNATCTVNNTLVNLGETIGWYLSLILDNQNSPVISYYSGNSLKLAKCSDSICSTKEFNIIDSVGDVGDSSSIILNKQGYPVISYFDKTNKDLKLAICGNTTCTANNTLTIVDDAGGADMTGAGGFTSLALNSQGYPVISYFDIDNGDLKLAVCGNVTCTINTLTTVDSTGIVGRYSSLALNSQGNPVIGYYDTTNQDLKLAVCDNPTCSPLPEIDLQGNNISIPNGDTTPMVTDNTDFGSVNIGDAPTNTFTILNIGVRTLNLTKVSLSGSGCEPFSMILPTSLNLEPNESTTFQVTFAPTSESTFNCTVNIDNNDSDENPYTFALTGKGQSTPPIPSPPPAQPLPPTMNLTINFGGTGHGHVTTDPSGIDCDSNQAKCSHSVDTASWIKLIPTAAANSKFTGWGGFQSDCDNGELFMSGFRSCTANFELLRFPLTVTTVGQGKVSSNPAGIDCSQCAHDFDTGTEVTLTAVPGDGWQFKEWSGACDKAGHVKINVNRQCQAIFDKIVYYSYPLTIKPMAVTSCSEGNGTQFNPKSRPMRGSVKWSFILCRFQDSETPPRDVNYYCNMLVREKTGGIADYWHDISYNNLDTKGSIVAGWYTIPMTVQRGREIGRWDKVNACRDAARTAVVNPYTPPSDHRVGIITYPDVDMFGWNGGAFLPYQVDVGGVAHEAGHGIGLNHSFSNDPSYRNADWAQIGEYDDPWDVMSWGNAFRVPTPFGDGPVGLTGFHLDRMGWLPRPRIITFGANGVGNATLTLAAINHPETPGPLLVRIPFDPADLQRHYTVEFRRKIRWDAGIPGDIVLIHEIQRHDDGVYYAHLVYQFSPNKQPARSLLANGVTIRVDSINASSNTATVTITNEIVNRCVMGYVWREANTIDKVCVTPTIRTQTREENRLAASRRSPTGGPYGPDTCKPSFVWREAFSGDHVCVPPASRTQARQDNGEDPNRRNPARFAYGPNSCKPGYVWREADNWDWVCVTPEVRAQTRIDNTLATSRRSPTGGSYGTDTCLAGFVWREAFPNDHVCVRPETRTQARNDNAQAGTRLLVP